MSRNLSLVRVIVMAFCVVLSVGSHAQDKNTQAIVYYNKAETAFNGASYEDALNYLTKAEDLLGASNTKILYLKVKTLDLLAKIDASRIKELQRALAQFFQNVDQVSYPKDKYIEITTIDVDLKDRLGSENEDYKKIKDFNNISELESYLTKHPASKYDRQLRPKYDSLKQKQPTHGFSQGNDQWINEFLPVYTEYMDKKKGKMSHSDRKELYEKIRAVEADARSRGIDVKGLWMQSEQGGTKK